MVSGQDTLSGIIEVFRPASGHTAPALEPAVKLYILLNDILSPEAKTTFCRYLQAAAKERARILLSGTDEYITQNNEGCLMDLMTMFTAYQKMKTLCMNLRNEIHTDIQIHDQNILPSFVDLPNLSASIYNTELCNRLQAFLRFCPPTGPSSPVAELVIATSYFQRDLLGWNINPIKGGVDAKVLFHQYILDWIQDKRLSLLESCKLEKVMMLCKVASLIFLRSTEENHISKFSSYWYNLLWSVKLSRTRSFTQSLIRFRLMECVKRLVLLEHVQLMLLHSVLKLPQKVLVLIA